MSVKIQRQRRMNQGAGPAHMAGLKALKTKYQSNFLQTPAGRPAGGDV
jgi:hypothetical protein